MNLDTAPGATATSAVLTGRGHVGSCLTCSKAKAKCVKRPGATLCERCFRLKKECVMREPSTRRRRITKTSRAAQLEQLENKIEHLVNALSASQNVAGQPSPPTSVSDAVTERPTSHQEGLGSLCSGEMTESQDDCCSAASVRYPMTPASTDSSKSRSGLTVTRSRQASSSFSDYEQLGVDMQEAESLLARWRKLMAPMFPFVVIPEGATACELRSSKPLLLHALVTVSHFHDLPKQQIMVKQFMRDVSERILINNEKNLGIVQGLLVFVSWYHPHIFWGQQVSNLLHLAMSMIVDLGLDRTLGPCSDFKGAATKMACGPNSVPRAPALEEHRVLLGTFYLASMLGSSFKKVDPPRWTKHMTDCLDNLVRAKEHSSDLLLVQVVRLQHLAEETLQLDTSSAPVQLYVKGFEAELNQIKQSHACVHRMPDNQQLRLQYLTAEIFVWGLSLTAIQDNKNEPLRKHIDGLYRCASAIKAYVDEYFTLPADSYLTQPYSTFGQVANALITLTRLATLEVDGWDFANCHTVEYPATLERTAMYFDSVAQSRPDGLHVNNQCFSKWAHRLRWMKGVYEAKYPKRQQDSTVPVADQAVAQLANCRPGYVQTPGTASSGYQQPTPDDTLWCGEVLNNLDADFWDQDFWNSLGGEYNLGFSPDMQMQMAY